MAEFQNERRIFGKSLIQAEIETFSVLERRDGSLSERTRENSTTRGPIAEFASKPGILLSVAQSRYPEEESTEVIIWDVADNSVNEYFGGIMITLTPDEVRARFGPLFSERYLVMVDRVAGAAEILETCRARGPVEWDAMNRRRAGGAIDSCTVEGSTLRIRTRLGRYPVRFGPAEAQSGGQALEAVELAGDEVVTSWAGIAGAGVGVAACLPQAPGVTRAEYPDEADLTVGGARANRVRIISPVYEKVVIGIDDTDTEAGGATWVLALQCAAACPVEDVHLLGMRLVQLNPAVPNKTTNCVGSALVYAVRSGHLQELEAFVAGFVSEHSLSPDAGVAVRSGIVHPDGTDAMRRVKTEILTRDEAEDDAERLNVRFIDQNRGKGRIGALGALLWADEGPEAAGLYGEDL